MNLRRLFGLCTLAALVFTVAVGEGISADNPTKKEIRLAQKKAAEVKKAAEDAAKVAAAKPKPATPAGNPAFSKVAPPEPATPLKPHQFPQGGMEHQRHSCDADCSVN